MSLAETSSSELLDNVALALRLVDPKGTLKHAHDSLAELQRRAAEPTYWPEETFAAAKEAFGPAVFNVNTRTYRALDRRIRHALRVWGEKYGPLNAEQEAYADLALAGAIRGAKREAGRDTKKLWPFTQSAIGRLVVHERVHDGFTRRQKLVDVTATLASIA